MTRRTTWLMLVLLGAVAGGQAQEKSPNATTQAGAETSPERSMRALLKAYIDRDPAAVLKYAPLGVQNSPATAERWKSVASQFMADDRRVLRVVDVKLEKMELRQKDRVATFRVQIETTPRFTGLLPARENIREYKWLLVQPNGRGPWYHDGGGF